jgi:hypothetical protein
MRHHGSVRSLQREGNCKRRRGSPPALFSGGSGGENVARGDAGSRGALLRSMRAAGLGCAASGYR